MNVVIIIMRLVGNEPLFKTMEKLENLKCLKLNREEESYDTIS